jgi:hypothetical protein
MPRFRRLRCVIHERLEAISTAAEASIKIDRLQVGCGRPRHQAGLIDIEVKESSFEIDNVVVKRAKSGDGQMAFKAEPHDQPRKVRFGAKALFQVRDGAGLIKRDRALAGGHPDDRR